MNFYWVYDLPTWVFASLTMGVFSAFSLTGLLLTRKLVLRLFGKHSHNDIVSFYLSTVGVFYGITLGLIAVGTYSTYSAVEQGVSEEAATIAAVYRDVSSYPEPARTALRGVVETYVNYIIEKAWPLQREGIVPPVGDEGLSAMQAALAGFNPASEGQKIVHAEALRQFNRLVELRRLRFQSVTTGLPETMYMVIIIGALLNIMVSWLFFVENVKMHGVLNVLMAGLLGLLVFLIAAMDNPFRGSFSVGPDAFKIIREQVMKPDAAKAPQPVP